MELEAYKAELAREILMSDSRQLLDKVKMVLYGESSVNINTVKEDCVPYIPRTKSEVLDDLKEACETDTRRKGKRFFSQRFTQ